MYQASPPQCLPSATVRQWGGVLAGWVWDGSGAAAAAFLPLVLSADSDAVRRQAAATVSVTRRP